MRNLSRTTIVVLIIIIVVAAVVISIFGGNNENGPAFSVISTADNGTSLLYDTLKHMDYPVRIGRHPLTTFSDVNDVYVIIQPFAPAIDNDMAAEILEWVQQGGRLIFLHNIPQNAIERNITATPQAIGGRQSGLLLYNYGLGQVITGRTGDVLNINLIENAAMGVALHNIISHWNADIIWFAGYYHGMHPPEDFLGNIPFIVRLLIAQLLLACATAMWHLGKRFGNPQPYYEAVEREANEHVHALARLYKKATLKEKSD